MIGLRIEPLFPNLRFTARGPLHDDTGEPLLRVGRSAMNEPAENVAANAKFFRGDGAARPLVPKQGDWNGAVRVPKAPSVGTDAVLAAASDCRADGALADAQRGSRGLLRLVDPAVDPARLADVLVDGQGISLSSSSRLKARLSGNSGISR